MQTFELCLDKSNRLMAKNLQISHQPETGKTLSKRQKQFNSLVKKIAECRVLIDEVKKLDLELCKLGETLVTPVEKQLAEAQREWVMILHRHPAKDKLKNKKKTEFAAVMENEIGHLLNSPFFPEDEELHALYREYESEGRDFEEVLTEMEQDMKSGAINIMQDMFGLDLNMEDFDDPEKLYEKLHAKQEEFEAEEAARQQKRATRKKTPAQSAAETKRAEAEKALNKTVKELYLELVRHFHPDREPDEQKRLEKTEIMKRITAAYDADDHLKLLELQMELLQKGDNVFADFNDAQLEFFNKTLRRQAAELEEEYHWLSPTGNGNPYARFFVHDLKKMKWRVQQHVRDLKNDIEGVKINCVNVREERMFKEYIKMYWDFYA